MRELKEDLGSYLKKIRFLKTVACATVQKEGDIFIFLVHSQRLKVVNLTIKYLNNLIYWKIIVNYCRLSKCQKYDANSYFWHHETSETVNFDLIMSTKKALDLSVKFYYFGEWLFNNLKVTIPLNLARKACVTSIDPE